MPAIKDMMGGEFGEYVDTRPSPPPDFQPERGLMPARDSQLRFSAPFLPGTFPSSDTLRGFHLGGMIPQWRVPVPAQALAQGAGTSTKASTTVSSSSSSTTTNNPAKAQTASLTTPTLAPGAQFTGVLTMAKAFVVLTMTISAPARVRLYSTLSAQAADLARLSTQGPGFGTEQGIIGDIYLDTIPVVWQAVNMVGANGDNPQSASIYASIDNISNSSETVTLAVVYVPVQS